MYAKARDGKPIRILYVDSAPPAVGGIKPKVAHKETRINNRNRMWFLGARCLFQTTVPASPRHFCSVVFLSGQRTSRSRPPHLSPSKENDNPSGNNPRRKERCFRHWRRTPDPDP